MRPRVYQAPGASTAEGAVGYGGAVDVAPDGSPVAFYRRLPAMGEPELIAEVLPAGTILDLGCGTGRIAGPLARAGYHVTGVDNGAGMIASLPSGVEGIVADAATVRLGRSFDAVLLASHLVNDPDHGPAFARTAAAHLVPDGAVIGETYPPGWDPEAGVGKTSTLGPASVTLLRAAVDGDLLDAEVRYGVDGIEWTQPFVARVLDEPALRALLADAGLAFDRWLRVPGWFIARSAGP
jgi:SAM-dependent methyltransferase